VNFLDTTPAEIVHVVELLKRVETFPDECDFEAREVLEETRSPFAVAVAQRCIGLAERTRGRFGEALLWLEASVATASSADLHLCVAQSQVALASCLAASGEYHVALSILNEALPHLDEKSMASAKNYAGFVLRRTEHPQAALAAFAEAEQFARRNNQVSELAKILNNRSVLLTELGDMEGAEHDLRNAARCFDFTDQGLNAAKAEHNLGWLLARQGRVAEALRVYANADARGGDALAATSTGARDRAELYLTARLFRESLHSATQARELAVRSGFSSQLPEIDLLTGRVLACLGLWEQAAESFSSSEQLCREHGRDFTANVAHWCLEVSSLRGTGSGTVPHWDEVLRGQFVNTAGSGPRETDLHVADLVDVAFAGLVSELGVAPEDPRNRPLRSIVSTGFTSGNATSRIQSLVIRAAFVARIPGAAFSDVALAVTGLLDSIRQHFENVPSQELRTIFVDSMRVEPIVVDCAILFDRPDLYIEWLEQLRRSTNEETRYSGVGTSVVGTEEMRKLTGSEPDDGIGPKVALRIRSATEFEVRQATWSVIRKSPPRFGSDERLVSPQTNQENLETLLCYAMSTTDLVVLQQHANERQLFRLSPTNHIATAIDAVRIAVSGLLRSAGRSSFPDTIQNLNRRKTAVERTLQRLDNLVAPPALPPGPVAIVGNGLLATIPWQLLSSFAGRPVTTYPTIADWSRPALSSCSSVGIVCGPGLEFGEKETAAVASLYNNAVVLTGSQATIESVCTLMTEVDTLHIVAHGSRRSDSAFFSGIELVGGALTGYDLARLDIAPARVILSCCDLGAANSKGLSSSLGLMSTLRNRGSHEISAPVMLVDDAATAEIMISVHRYLLKGLRLAEAISRTLSDAADTAGAMGSIAQLTAGSFNTMGR
jgi:tetratricopeptide (TPR) repeat protein